LHNTAEKRRIGIRTKLYNKKEGEYMRAKHSIVINGRSYDAVTGMPLSDAAPAKPVVERGETVTVTVKHPTTRTPAKTALHIGLVPTRHFVLTIILRYAFVYIYQPLLISIALILEWSRRILAHQYMERFREWRIPRDKSIMLRLMVQ
jgi:hypothetical protein